MDYELLEEEDEYVDNIHEEAITLKHKVGGINRELEKQNK